MVQRIGRRGKTQRSCSSPSNFTLSSSSLTRTTSTEKVSTSAPKFWGRGEKSTGPALATPGALGQIRPVRPALTQADDWRPGAAPLPSHLLHFARALRSSPSTPRRRLPTAPTRSRRRTGLYSPTASGASPDLKTAKLPSPRLFPHFCTVSSAQNVETRGVDTFHLRNREASLPSCCVHPVMESKGSFWWLSIESSLLMCLGRQQRMAQVLVPCIHVGDADEAPGSWLQSGPALAIESIWEVNQQMEDSLSLVRSHVCVFAHLLLLFLNSAFQINKINLKKK
ncbi:uncharacterized protein LOC133765283 [Lepus europaeus]|uniref:uncharacterized protein LOC133765283 n=1 Tax=Lepus europaeus TaxID=9983 RepID=UPI002B47F274|nr:uncharacterized protein LOC133765283 [Lepus europaeus]